MINYIQLLINEPATAELDLDTSFNIALQYSLADIRDISKRNSAYSKTIILPGTKKNNYWMGDLFDINTDFTFFNPNKKTNCKFLVNSETVINGFMQLRKINKLVNADAQGNMIQYEVVIYNNAVDLMTELGEKVLYDLNLFDYNHTFNQAAIEASWQHTWEDGYVYPMYGTHEKDYQYDADWFFPCPFYKTVFDRIITDAGYGWTGSFYNNDQFNQEIIAFVKDGNVYVGAAETERRQFRAGVTASNIVDYGKYVVSYSANWPLLYSQSPGPQNNDYTTNYPADDDFTSPNFDNGPDNWNTTTYQWTTDRNGGYRVDYSMNYNLRLKNNTAFAATLATGTTFKVNIVHRIQTSSDGGATWDNWENYVFPVSYSAASIGAGAAISAPVNFTRLMTNIKVLPIGTLVRLVIEPKSGSTGYYPYQSANTPGGAAVGMNVEIEWLGTDNYILNHAEPAEITQGDQIDLGQFLPDKIKQKDLISDLIKRYNLYIEVSPDDPKLLIFSERPNYYAEGETLDWTDKKDYSSPDNITLLSELQFKELKWDYKPDKDYYNEEYEAETGDIFGQYEYIFDNDFVKGVKKITSPFSPTPIVKTDFGAYVAAIDPESQKVKPRYLYWGGLKDYGGNWVMTYQDTATASGGADYNVTYNQYPYAGHWDDPIEPTLDIHFGTPKVTFYSDYTQLPTDTMYNTYWSDYVDQIEDGRLVTSFFNLKEDDIRYIKDNFNTKIFVLDSYYYINKIIDYKPLENGLTKVELLKTRDGINWVNEGNVENTTVTDGPCPNDMVAKRFKTGWFYVSASGAAVSEACCDLTNGIWDADTQRCKAKVKPVIAFSDFKKGANRPVTTGGNGNEGDGIIFGNQNYAQGTKTIEKFLIDYDWILATGYWDDNGEWIDTSFWQDSFTSSGAESATYSFIVKNTQFVVGDNNKLNDDNNFVLGSDNDVSGEGGMVLAGNNNTIDNGSIVIGADDLVIGATESQSIYLGPSFSVDITTGVAYAEGLVIGGLTMSPPGFQHYKEVTASYSVTIVDYYVIVRGTASNVIVTLPEIVFGGGKQYHIKNLLDQKYTVEIRTDQDTEYFEGDSNCTTLTLDQYDSVALVSRDASDPTDGDGWLII